MKTHLKSAAFAVALAVAAPAEARNMTVKVSMADYYGTRAYAVVYVVDPNGKYVATLYKAGGRSKYRSHMRRWLRLKARARKGYDGNTGASAGSGSSFGMKVKIPDAMFDAGYVLRVESVVERRKYYPDSAIVPLDAAHNRKPVAGKGYVRSVTVGF